MKRLEVRNETRGALLGSQVLWARRMFSRMRGFLFRSAPSEGEGILLSPCRGVHMFGMRFPLDVLFISREGRVVATYPGLQPGQRTPVLRDARHALELPAGTIDRSGTRVGDTIMWDF